ncbi:hypothetical protein EDC96DRAFT_581705 [Choanephora cucurbitarum]|nr:hypothetical protein EDC96DRAFT_581705 [Choanephora cucurbitarum]
MKSVSLDDVVAKEEVYEFDAIVDHRGEPNNREYKVRWKNYTAADDSWITADLFTDPMDIQKYWRRVKGTVPKDETKLLKKLATVSKKKDTFENHTSKGPLTEILNEPTEEVSDTTNSSAVQNNSTTYRRTSHRTRPTNGSPMHHTVRLSTRVRPQTDRTRFTH